MFRKGFTIVELLVVITIIGMMCAIIIGGCSVAGYGTSEGHRDGYVQKVSKVNGYTTSSYEADLAMPGLGGSSTGLQGQASMGNVWSFSIADLEVYQQLNKLTAKQFVRVYYKQVRWNWPHNTTYLATKVELLEDK